jgi:sigma-70-like protein
MQTALGSLDKLLVDEPKFGLDQISTRWPLISDPVQFVLRYAPAIQRYMLALIKDPHDAEEVLQDFLLRWIQRDFVQGAPIRGRFRNYLKVAVRNAALTYFRTKQTRGSGDFDLGQLAAPEDGQQTADLEWVAEWQRCTLARAWQALDNHQRRHPGNLCHTVLQLTVKYPQDDSPTLAVRASTQTGHPLNAEAFRKQLSRARRLMAEFLLKEVAQTLENPGPAQVEEELIEIGLMSYVRDFLPADKGSWSSLLGGK